MNIILLTSLTPEIEKFLQNASKLTLQIKMKNAKIKIADGIKDAAEFATSIESPEDALIR